MRPATTIDQLPGDPLEFLRRRLARCREGIAGAARRSGRRAEDVLLVAVTKYADTSIVRGLHRLGVRDFAESRAQELERKTRELANLPETRWHFIGHVQRNKVRKVLDRCEAIHSVDSPRLVEEIARRVESSGRPSPGLWLEVDIAAEERKTGVPVEELPALLESLRKHRSLATMVRGLMAMAPYADDPEASRPTFRRLRELRDDAIARGALPPDAGLSMGMSRDFRVAVEEGATVVRIGSRLFAPEEP